MKTAQFIAELQAQNDGEKPEQASAEKPKRAMNPNSLRNLVAPWTAENHPRSPGRPKDRAGELARKVIENNEEAIYQGLASKAMAGDAYAFSVLADRGYGKLKQGIVHTGDEDGGPLQSRVTVEFVKPDIPPSH